MADKYSAEISGFRKTQPPKVPTAGNGPACDDSNYWEPSNDPEESTIEVIEKGFGLK